MSTSRVWWLVLGCGLAGVVACAPANGDEELGGATSNLDESDRAADRDGKDDEAAKKSPSKAGTTAPTKGYVPHEKERNALRDRYVEAWRRAKPDDFQEFSKICSGFNQKEGDETLRWDIWDPDLVLSSALRDAELSARWDGFARHAMVVKNVTGGKVELTISPELNPNWYSCQITYSIQFMSCRFAEGASLRASDCTIDAR